MALANLGPLAVDLALPAAGTNVVRCYDAMQQNTAWANMISAFGGTDPARYFCPEFNVRWTYDATHGGLNGVLMWRNKVVYAWTIEWTDAGAGYRPDKIHWWIDPGTAEPPVPSPGVPLPSVREVTEGLSYMGRHVATYGTTDPLSLTRWDWVDA